MRYDSLFSWKKWQSDSSKGFGTHTSWPYHSVKLLYFLPKYSFSNLDCSGLGWQNYLKFDSLVSNWPKFNTWTTFSKMVTDFIHLTPSQTWSFFWLCELRWTWHTSTNILVCYSVTSCWISCYHIPIWRGYIGLSDDPTCLNISGEMRELEREETSRWISPVRRPDSSYGRCR